MGGIKYKIINPEVKIDWHIPETTYQNHFEETLFNKIKQKSLSFIRSLISQNNRNKNIDIQKLMLCKKCNSENFILKDSRLECKSCNHFYPYKFTSKNK